jgi:hypothetical protein
VHIAIRLVDFFPSFQKKYKKEKYKKEKEKKGGKKK